MPEVRGRSSARRRGRRLLLILLGLALWTLWACYPNPWVLARNLVRYARFPVDPRAAARIAWRLPEDPREIEEIVRIAVSYQYDWRQYGVPWYMPTPAEVLDSRRGDCESQAVLLASLLAAKRIPFEVKASFTHLWIDYPGKLRTPEENDEVAYLRRVKGRYHFGLPRLVDWGTVLRAQKAANWDAMPPARRLTLCFGWALILWLAAFGGQASPRSGRFGLANSGGAGGGAEGRRGVLFVSQVSSAARRQPRLLGRRVVGRGLLFAAAAMAVLAYWQAPEFRVEALATWAMAAMGGLLASAILGTRAVGWLSIAPGEARMVSTRTLGPFRRQRKVAVEQVAALRLRGEPEAKGRFRLEAQLYGGIARRKVRLLDYADQVTARKDLAALSRVLGKPAKLCLGKGELDLPEAGGPSGVSISLRERWARSRERPVTLPRPEGCRLEFKEGAEDSGEGFSLASPGLPLGERWWLAAFVLAACGSALSGAAALFRLPAHGWPWAVWLGSALLVALVLVFLLTRTKETLLGVYGARLELKGGQLRFQAAGKQEALEVRDVTSVELYPRNRESTILLVGRERLISLRGLGRAEDQEWVRATVELAILRAQEGEARLARPQLALDV